MDEYKELMDRDPGVRDLVDRMMPAVLLAEEVLRILGEAEAVRDETQVSDRTSGLETRSASTPRELLGAGTGTSR